MIQSFDLMYRLTGVEEKREMRWTEYTVSMLLFSGVSMTTLLYLIERTQRWLPFNPQKFANVDPGLAFGTAATKLWYASPAIYVRSFAASRGKRRTSSGISGSTTMANTMRCLLWVLLPICILGSLVLVSQGVVQNLKPYTTVDLIRPYTAQVTGADGKTTTQTVSQQVIAQGPVASQEVICEFRRSDGRRPRQSASRHTAQSARRDASPSLTA